MSEFVRELVPVIFMYTFVAALAPLVVFTMWMIFDGDRVNSASDDSDSVDSPE